MFAWISLGNAVSALNFVKDNYSWLASNTKVYGAYMLENSVSWIGKFGIIFACSYAIVSLLCYAYDWEILERVKDKNVIRISAIVAAVASTLIQCYGLSGAIIFISAHSTTAACVYKCEFLLRDLIIFADKYVFKSEKQYDDEVDKESENRMQVFAAAVCVNLIWHFGSQTCLVFCGSTTILYFIVGRLDLFIEHMSNFSCSDWISEKADTFKDWVSETSDYVFRGGSV